MSTKWRDRRIYGVDRHWEICNTKELSFKDLIKMEETEERTELAEAKTI